MGVNEALLRQAIEQFVKELLVILQEAKQEASPAPEPVKTGLTKRALIELVEHEGIVLEAYKDSVGVWTWGIGVTDKSGHKIGRYKDNPQTLERVVEIFEWLVRTQYLPDVLEAFKGHDLNEHQLAAAVSFHYNTGAIKRASWVKLFKQGKIAQARQAFMQWRKPDEIVKRRTAERDLFFDGKWSDADLATVYTRVRKPSYTPDWGSATKVDISNILGE